MSANMRHDQQRSERNKPNHLSQVSTSLETSQEVTARENTTQQAAKIYMTGWRRHLVIVGFWLALFLSTVETTIVSTSLVSVTNSLGGFAMRDWVVTTYLLAYTGFLTIYAKLGDIIGRKTAIMTAIGSFTLFSILCGISENITELIVFRAFQGFGASGIYSMTLVIGPTLVPPGELPKYIGVISTVFALASVVGPLMGGVISQNGKWRWVFLFNAPAGVLALLIIGLILPATTTTTTGNHTELSMWMITRQKLSWANLRRIDGLGVAMLLASSALLVYAFESAGNDDSWSSASIIVTIIIGTGLFAAFVSWECWLQRRPHKKVEPIFPPRILRSRVMASMFAASFFLGFPFTSVVINNPQRAQAVYAFSSQHAGITLLPLLLTSSFATLISGFLTSTWNVPPVYVIISGAVTQVIGIGLTCSLSTTTLSFPSEQYGFEAIMGIGFGLTLSTILTLAQLVAHEDDRPVVMGAITQVRVFGGTFGLAISATVVNGHVRSKLATRVSPKEMQAISNSFSAIGSLSPQQQYDVRVAFAEGFNQQNIVLTAFSGVALLSCVFLWEKRQRIVEKSSS